MNSVEKNSVLIMLAASFASTIGGLPFNALPILLGSLADSFQLEATQIGLLASACFTGYFAGTIAAFLLINRVSWKMLTMVSACSAAAMLYLSAVSAWELQMILWAVIGFFASLMTCLGLRIMGEMENKERALGLRQGIELGVTSLVLFMLPAYVISSYGYHGAAIALLIIIFALSLSAFFLPARHSALEVPSVLSQLKIPVKAWLALGVFLLFCVGNIGLWAFLERIGNGLDLAPSELGIVFAVLKLLGGAAAFVIVIVGNRLGLRLPFIIVLSVILVGLVFLWHAEAFIGFALGAWVWEVGFTWGCVYMTATVARLDSKGQAILLIPAFFALSSMIGPGVAGMISRDGYTPVIWFALLSSVLAIGVFVTVILKQGAGEKDSG